MKIIIVVPDGVGVRNYLYSSFIDHFNNADTEVIIYHKISESAIEEIKKEKPFLNNFIEIPSFVESPLARLLRESLCYARLLRNKKILKNKTILNFWNPNKKGIKKKLLYLLSEVLGTIFSKSTNLIGKADKKYESIIAKADNGIKDLLIKQKPDFILNLHQRASLTAPIFSKATDLNIKTATVIFSWDNVPKARLISRYDYYFVWSNLMKEQLLLLYPEIKKQQIKITGTPQFEFYFNSKNYTIKELFFAKYGLDPNKKTICFSGNDTSSPYEANYLNDICQEISKIDENERPQVLFRKCPVDKTNRFDTVIEKYKNLVYSVEPDWKLEKGSNKSFSSIYPTINDNFLLANTIKHSDIVINLGSTMAHDAVVLNKPCLYLNYNPVNKSTFKVEDVFNFEHFKELKTLDAVGWINKKSEISKKVLFTLKNPEKVGKERKKWMEEIVTFPLENNSNKIFKTISNLINK